MKTSQTIARTVVRIGTVVGGYFGWRHVDLHRSTDDACLGANAVRVEAAANRTVRRACWRSSMPSG
ncbi:MAG: hypothetical protein H6960_03360 [Chromatiaceae bacterium]|nr:hypothetical protein [Chromatiaceae bacterium]MCP5439302.1 hypothetical protein [Chromatiaceae bacterium]